MSWTQKGPRALQCLHRAEEAGEVGTAAGRPQTRLKISVPEPESCGGGANTGSQEGAGLIRVSAEGTTQPRLLGDLNPSGQEWAGQPVGRPLLTWAEFGVLQPEGWWREVSRPGACLGGGRSWTWGEEQTVTGTVVTVTVGDELEGSALGKVLWP